MCIRDRTHDGSHWRPPSVLRAKQRRKVQPEPREALGAGREAVRSHQRFAEPVVEDRRLDDALLDPTGNSQDLGNPAYARSIELEMHYQVDGGRDRGHDEAIRDVL